MKKNKILDAECIFEKKKWISVTGLCNNNCIFCLDGGRIDKYHKSEEDVKKEIDRGLEDGATRLVLSGGEPTIHPKIINFVEYGKERGYKKVQIITNGRMFASKEWTDKIIDSGLDEVTFSIHGYNSEMHDSLTRVPGSFIQITKGIRNVKKNPKNIIVNTDTCITKLNYKYLPEIIEFLYSLGVREVNLMSIVSLGNAWKNKERVIYKFEDIVPYVNKTIDFCKEKNIFLWLSRYPPKYLLCYEEYIESHKKIFEDVIACGEDFFKKTPKCYGERCEYCGINSVCRNLISGDYTTFIPPCQFNEKEIEKKVIKRRNKSFKDFAEEVCLNSRIKGLACDECIFNNSCEGVLREKIREKGFDIMKPITNKIKIQKIEE